jgi:three-Cys-motif partner protein
MMGISGGSPKIIDDGLIIPEVGSWAENKYRQIALYDELFSTGMKNKWRQRVYIDLYAGAGYSRIKGTQIPIKGSPLIALSVNTPFDKYVFCEEDDEKLGALKKRVKVAAPSANVVFVKGKCDECIDEILGAVPTGSASTKVLSLCLVDPYDFGFKFATIKKLSQRFMDFLILLAVEMDANRNYKHYVGLGNTKIDEALGNREWRNRWRHSGLHRSRFPNFLAEEFSRSMTDLGYLERKPYDMKLVKLQENNRGLYYLALFSRNATAYEFWKDVLKYGTDQRGLWD